MTYKLAVEKKHRASKGGKRAGKITKGEPHGRVLHSRYDEKTDEIVLTHSTRGVLRRNRSIMIGPAQ